MNAYRAAAVQMNSTPNLKANLEQAAELVALAAEEQADLVVLPENFAFFGPDDQKVAQAYRIARQTQQFLCDQAIDHEIHIVGGGFPWPTKDGRTLNRALWFDPEGHSVARYDKIHLFDADLPDLSLRESDTVVPGTSLVLVDDEHLGKVGLTICYDLRFPELYRKLASDGAQALLVPSAFTEKTGPAHWEVLLRARAIENSCYVIAPAQCGQHFENRRSHGHSLIVDPWGEILADAGEEPGVILADIAPDRLYQVRHALPSLRHRRLG